jgi:hypothetical protein
MTRRDHDAEGKGTGRNSNAALRQVSHSIPDNVKELTNLRI